MSWNYGFFNSVNGDRLYNSEDMNTLFDGLITSGVYASVGNKLAVQPNGGMTIKIATGRGWFNRHWVNNDAPYTLALESADVTLNRIAAICIRVNESEGVRTAVPVIKYSDYATNPAKPSMTRSNLINEYCLAYVTIRAGATSITASNIEDTRGNNELCGWVTGLIEQLSTTTLYEQWTDMFNTWFIGLQNFIDSNVATKLTNALPTSVTVSLPVSGWSNNSQTVTVTSMNTTKSVIVQANDSSASMYSKCGVKCTGQTANKLTFTCDTVPTANISVKVLHMGV